MERGFQASSAALLCRDSRCNVQLSGVNGCAFRIKNSMLPSSSNAMYGSASHICQRTPVPRRLPRPPELKRHDVPTASSQLSQAGRARTVRVKTGGEGHACGHWARPYSDWLSAVQDSLHSLVARSRSRGR
ncbi:hypothetical protein VTK56DRAFT_9889 [Thermocarpiscus australiensis]